jgi:diguanylate cyclase (GGDEF)-like protein
VIENLKNKLKNAVSFPSPPAVAQQIIELAGDPDIDVTKVASAIAKDPGLTAKVLRVANSPLYSKKRKSDNLRQALVVLGLNAATTLALSFSLVATYRGVKSNGIDYTRYWRRTILCASAARAFGAFKQIRAVEDLFLAALLQDIAVIAVDRVQPDFYAKLSTDATHAEFIAYEIERLGMDHAALGSWLLSHWKLTDSLCQTVAWSHAPPASDGETNAAVAARCVALGSECVEILLTPRTPMDLTALSHHAAAWLGMGADALADTMAKIVAEIPEIERLFDTSLMDADASAAMIEQARELLMMRNLQAIEQVSTLQQSADYFQTRAAEFEDKHRRDPLTGVFNRGHLDQVLEQEFQSATAGGWPLSIVFADLDRFKQVNDTYGHPAGDTVLIATAKLILEVVRDTDCVARYGGEEFVIILPGLALKDAQTVCERLLKRLRSTRHTLAAGPLTVTASLGLATHRAGNPYSSALELIEAADRSVYVAKKEGRDRLVCFDSQTRVHMA